MEVIASTAFGMDVDAQTTTDHPFVVNAGIIMGVAKLKTLKEKIKRLFLFTSLCKLTNGEYNRKKHLNQLYNVERQ